MSFHCEHRSDAEHDQNPDDEAGVPKESIDHGCDSSVETAYICANGKRSREMERRHESHFDRFDPPSYSYPRSKYGPRKATKLVGTVKGTKLWAGDCTASELRTAMPAEETSKPPPDEPVGAIPKEQQ